MNTAHIHAPSNLLLTSLPPKVHRLLTPLIEGVNLEAGQMLYEAGVVQSHVYFPVTAVVSLVSELQDGGRSEVAVVGEEGVVGVCAFMGGGKALSSAVVLRPGLAWRMSAHDITALSRDCEPLLLALLRYAQALFTAMAQTSTCNRYHGLIPQLCRWLLQHLDRQTSDEMQVTHERIADMLGVRRESVTGAALQLQSRGLIRYARGHLHVLDRCGLEQESCECYGVVRSAYAELHGETCAPSGVCAASARVWPTDERPVARRSPSKAAFAEAGETSSM
jgi:CRP-like cAMP-binding protein